MDFDDYLDYSNDYDGFDDFDYLNDYDDFDYLDDDICSESEDNFSGNDFLGTDSMGQIIKIEVIRTKKRKPIDSLVKNEKTDEEKEVDELLKKYDIVLNGNMKDNKKILKYKSFYNELIKYEKNKRKDIEDMEIENKMVFTDDDTISKKVKDMKDNANRIIDCINRIVERIKRNEKKIYKKKMQELDDMEVARHSDMKKVSSLNFKAHKFVPKNKKPLSSPEPILFLPSDIEMGVINKSLSFLNEWSNKQHYQFIFDSNSDGDGWTNNVLHDRVLHKSNLYFISSDNNGNIYGGYINNRIDEDNSYIKDNNIFIFSLQRNGKVKNKRYEIKKGNESYAFKLCEKNERHGRLYEFGGDIYVYRVESPNSNCRQKHFDYNGEKGSIVDKESPQFNFKIKRIIILEMS
ncbi:TLDc domain-containing protein [Entamoeba marina]